MPDEIKGRKLLLQQVIACEKFTRADTVPFSIGMRLGLIIATRHPEWAQAFVALTAREAIKAADNKVADQFIEDVPVEVTSAF